MRTLIHNIKTLVLGNDNPPKIVKGADMKNLPMLDNAFVLIENDKIVDWGEMSNISEQSADRTIDATGSFVSSSNSVLTPSSDRH